MSKLFILIFFIWESQSKYTNENKDISTWGFLICIIYWFIHRLISYLRLSVGAGQEATDLTLILFHLIDVHPQLFTGCVSRAVDFRCIVGVINVLSKNVGMKCLTCIKISIQGEKMWVGVRVEFMWFMYFQTCDKVKLCTVFSDF